MSAGLLEPVARVALGLLVKRLSGLLRNKSPYLEACRSQPCCQSDRPYVTGT